jgi:hypothetical protein
MNSGKELDRAKIEEAFRIMGQYLLDRNALGEIALYGGSAIPFQFDCRASWGRMWVTTVEGLRDIYREFFADQDLPAAAALRLSELARAIQSSSHP